MLNRYYPAVDDPNSAWKNHINAQESLDKINLSLVNQQNQSTKQSQALRVTINSANREYITSMKNMSEDISSSINYCSSRICDSLDQGFDLISDDIHELGRSLDIRLSLIMEQEIINNLLSENIALLLRIPDIQKERQYYLEQGIKHLKNAFIDKDFYENALENLLEAEKREKTDYITLHHIGMIYLYSSKYLDLPKAEDYFRRAGKFAKIESDPNAFKLANIMTGSVLTKLADNVSDDQKMRYVAAESYLQGAIACYIQKKYNEAAELGQIAFDLAPEMLEAGFYSCLSNALAGRSESTIKLLEKLVDKNPTYAFIAATDPILAPKDYIQSWLDKLKHDTINIGLDIVEDIKNKIIENSKFHSDLNAAQDKLHDANYLDALSIISYLNSELPINEETEIYKQNLANAKYLKEAIGINNRKILAIKNSSLSIQYLEAIDYIEIDENDSLNSSSSTGDQWLYSEEIYIIKNKIFYIIDKNREELDVIYSKFRKEKRFIENDRKELSYNIKYRGKKVVIGIGLVFSCIVAVKGCSKAANLPDYGGGLMVPFGYFFLYLIIGFIITFALKLLVEKIAKGKEVESKQEIDIFNDLKDLDKDYQVFTRLLNTLDNIKTFQFTARYNPFNEYFKQIKDKNHGK